MTSLSIGDDSNASLKNKLAKIEKKEKSAVV
jgi:hypothetical protein